jgi:hypothetical protein
MILAFMLPSVNVNAATKSYTISKKSQPLAKYKKLTTYNDKTKDYYIFKGVFEDCAKKGGGTIVIKKGDYTITNPIYIASNTTVIFEDGVTIKKGSDTGTSKLTASKSIFQLINPQYANAANHYSGYSGEHDINIIGEGSVTIDINYFEKGLAFVIGHTTNVTIKGIHFMNLNIGHFIELDASDNTLIDGCTFENAEGYADKKEAINIDTPDLATNGFNNIWSSHDKTPVKDTHITNCIFKNLKSCIGTHSASDALNPETGLYDIPQLHSNITIDYCQFINTSEYCIRMYAWKDAVIVNNTFSNDIKQGRVFAAFCTSNPTFKNNSMNNFAYIGNVKSMGENRVIGYEPICGCLYEQNITDFYNNSATNMDNSILSINKGITTAFPASNLNITGKEMKLQESSSADTTIPALI